MPAGPYNDQLAYDEEELEDEFDEELEDEDEEEVGDGHPAKKRKVENDAKADNKTNSKK